MRGQLRRQRAEPRAAERYEALEGPEGGACVPQSDKPSRRKKGKHLAGLILAARLEEKECSLRRQPTNLLVVPSNVCKRFHFSQTVWKFQ